MSLTRDLMPNSSDILRHMENHLALTTCEDIKNVMQPLLTKHSMTVFNYYRIYFDSTVIRLSTDQKWTEHYFKMNYLETLTIPESYLKKTLNYYLWLTDDCPLMLQDAAINFDTANGISIAKINHDSIEYFCFASTRDNTSIVNNFYLNNLDVLEQYSLYFKDQFNFIISQFEKNKIILPNNASCCHRNKMNKEIKKSLLSPRQKDCAKLLLQGMSYKEIGKILQLSARTVETHINQLKTKLRCDNKAELIIQLNGIITR